MIMPARVQLLDLPLDAPVARLLDLAQHLHVAVHGQSLARLQQHRMEVVLEMRGRLQITFSHHHFNSIALKPRLG